MTVYDVAWNRVKARKEHDCNHCGKVIEKGVEYERLYNMWGPMMPTTPKCSVHIRCRDEYDKDNGEVPELIGVFK